MPRTAAVAINVQLQPQFYETYPEIATAARSQLSNHGNLLNLLLYGKNHALLKAVINNGDKNG
jgi:hypothetical protein